MKMLNFFSKFMLDVQGTVDLEQSAQNFGDLGKTVLVALITFVLGYRALVSFNKGNITGAIQNAIVGAFLIFVVRNPTSLVNIVQGFFNYIFR